MFSINAVHKFFVESKFTLEQETAKEIQKVFWGMDNGRNDVRAGKILIILGLEKGHQDAQEFLESSFGQLGAEVGGWNGLLE